MSNDKRLREVIEWLEVAFGDSDFTIEPASSDASFRRYFRVRRGPLSWIIMDAPPEQEDVRPFIKVAELFAGAGVNVPRIDLQDQKRGFLQLTDFGQVCYLERLSESSADALYGDAMDALLNLQLGVDAECGCLPCYDEPLLRREMMLFQEWFLEKLLMIELMDEQKQLLEVAQIALVKSALEQPRVCVHRDYHSRNLMVTGQENPGIIDFQDAVIGPVTYDLASLLKDCYISWPEERVEGWLRSYHLQLTQAAVLTADFETFYHWFDLMGVQRHLKAIGIFSRLKLRDGKAGYLADIPRTLNYIQMSCQRRPELAELGLLIEALVLPKMDLLSA